MGMWPQRLVKSRPCPCLDDGNEIEQADLCQRLNGNLWVFQKQDEWRRKSKGNATH